MERGTRRVEVIIPWRGGCPHRERALDFIRELYPWPVTIAPGGEPWCKAEAVIPAVVQSAAEVIVVADADVWASGVEEAVQAVFDGAPWAIPHRGVYRLSGVATGRFLAGEGDPTKLPLDQPPYLGTEGGGVVVGTREALLEAPLDRRFVGWGQEDEAWGIALRCLFGAPVRIARPLIHLWHPPQPRMDRRHGSVQGALLRRRYRRACNDPDAMRALIREVSHDEHREPHHSSLHAAG